MIFQKDVGNQGSNEKHSVGTHSPLSGYSVVDLDSIHFLHS